MLREYSSDIANILITQNVKTKCVVLKIRDTDFYTVTRRRMLKRTTRDAYEIYQEVKALFEELPEFLEKGIRLLGVSVTSLQQEKYQETNLFSTLE